MEDIWDQRQAELVRGVGVNAGEGYAEHGNRNASARGGCDDGIAGGHGGGDDGGDGDGDSGGGGQGQWRGFWQRSTTNTTNTAPAPTSSSHPESLGGADKSATVTCLHHRVKLKDGTTNMPLRHPQQIVQVISAMVHEVEDGGVGGAGIRGLEAHPDFQYIH